MPYDEELEKERDQYTFAQKELERRRAAMAPDEVQKEEERLKEWGKRIADRDDDNTQNYNIHSA